MDKRRGIEGASPLLLRALESSGWAPEGARSASRIDWARVRQRGWAVPESAIGALEPLGRVKVRFTSRRSGMEETWTIDPEEAATLLKPSWAHEYEAQIGERILPIGTHGPMLLAIGESGSIYGLFDDTIAELGDDIVQALEAIVGGKAWREILEKPSR